MGKDRKGQFDHLGHVCTSFLCAVVVMAFVVFSPKKGLAESAQGNVSVTVQQLISITEDAPMSYGRVLTDGQADVITISPEGEVSSTNGTSIEGAVSAAEFNVAGSPQAAVSISFQDGQLSGSGEDMSISNFTHDAGTTTLFDDQGVLNFNVGADLAINAGQGFGDYSGSYTVNVDYN